MRARLVLVILCVCRIVCIIVVTEILIIGFVAVMTNMVINGIYGTGTKELVLAKTKELVLGKT